MCSIGKFYVHLRGKADCGDRQGYGEKRMEINKISGYSEFLSIVEYPAVVFCEDGEVLSVNNAAVRIIGSGVESLGMEPDKFMVSDEFWPTLEEKKAVIWHRLSLVVNGDEKYVVSGFINQFDYGGKKAYMVLFELRSDVTIGSVSLERIINHIGVIALYLYRPEGVWRTRYVSKNITEYGYTDGNFYSGLVSLSDLLPKSDYDLLIGQLYKTRNTGVTDFEMETRIISAHRDISKMQLKCHIVRTADGETDGIELLFIKDKEVGYDESQAEYILSAMSKIKSFVMIQQYGGGMTVFKYITPNAKQMGLNVDALKLGDKLIEDYIHPKDRSRVLANLRGATKREDKDYEEEFRLVNDRGEIIWVKSQSSVTQAADGVYTVEYFVSDITEQKQLESSVEKAKKEFDDKLSYIMKTNSQSEGERTHIDREKWTDIIKAFSTITGLYTTVIDPDGKKLVEPAGPQGHMGYFYDMFEKPAYRQIYMRLNEVILMNNVPVIMDMDDGIEGSKICGAPIMIDGKHIATWICCSYDEEDAQRMEGVYKIQWKLCRIFSEYAYTSSILAKEATRSKSIEVMMEMKVQWMKLLVDIISSSDKTQQQMINETISQVGETLNADVAAVYVRDASGDLDCEYIWSKNQCMSADEYVSEWQRANMRFHSWQNGQATAMMYEKGYLLLDASNSDDTAKKLMSRSQVKSFVAVPVYVNGRKGAVLVLANTSAAKVWPEVEVDFAKRTAEVIRCCLERIESDDSIKSVNSILLDTYNYMDEGIFIREAETGRVLFSNRALNDMLGYDFTDKDSKLLVENLRDKYKIMGGPDQKLDKQSKETRWTSYIKCLDKTMNLTEVTMKWLDGSDASLVLLREA